MQRALRIAAFTALTGVAAGIAAAALTAGEPGKRAASGPTLLETLTLMRYGHGAYGEAQSESRGERP